MTSESVSLYQESSSHSAAKVILIYSKHGRQVKATERWKRKKEKKRHSPYQTHKAFHQHKIIQFVQNLRLMHDCSQPIGIIIHSELNLNTTSLIDKMLTK